MTTNAMPEATAVLAQNSDDLIIRSDHLSFVIVQRLTAAAAKPTGHMNIGQVSPTRSVSDLNKK